ncbi:MAG: ABC transporter permease [Deltaproteobacteria bacterium]|nr:ABC transporter permease [Deltaproteobacteria bacterium]
MRSRFPFGLRLPAHVVRQRAVLTARYLDVLLGDVRAVSLLLVQAPLIAGLIVGVWSNIDSDSRSLYFVMCLSAFFLGAVNSAREIVKEREIFLRERMFDLSCRAYASSKMRVLFGLGLIQCTALTGIIVAFLPVKVGVFAIAGCLLAASVAGTAIGLFISATATTDDRAVMMVPLIVIPQILFSDFVLPGSELKNWTGALQRVMPVHWTYTLLEKQIDRSLTWNVAVAALLTLGLVVATAYFLTIIRLEHTTYSK